MSSVLLHPNTAEQEPSSQDTILVCPCCGHLHRPGELSCGHCGIVFSAAGRTRQMDNAEIPVEPRRRQPTGDAYMEEKRDIDFVIGSAVLPVTISNTLVLGRRTEIEGAPTPDVDLTAYEGDEKGVSRRHIRIECKHHLLYVFDLGSRNGTWLNGRLLVTNSRYLLRDGDELRLGRLKVRLRF